MTLRSRLGDDFTLCRSGIRFPVEEVFFFSFFGRFVFAIFIFNLLAGFNLFLYFCPVTASRGVAINVFLVIEDYFRH